MIADRTLRLRRIVVTQSIVRRPKPTPDQAEDEHADPDERERDDGEYGEDDERFHEGPSMLTRVALATALGALLGGLLAWQVGRLDNESVETRYYAAIAGGCFGGMGGLMLGATWAEAL